jgi:hypothetical protein
MTETPERLAQAFVAALAEDFAEHGAETIAKARSSRPDAYLRLIVALLPKDAPPRALLDGLSDDELAAAIVELTRQARPAQTSAEHPHQHERRDPQRHGPATYSKELRLDHLPPPTASDARTISCRSGARNND